jgi:hypothetical protein
LVILGGSNRNRLSDNQYHDYSGYQLDPVTSQWTEMSPNKKIEPTSATHSAFWKGNRLVICCSPKSEFLNQPRVIRLGGIYDPETNTWTDILDPHRLRPTQVTWAGDRLFVIGTQQIAQRDQPAIAAALFDPFHSLDLDSWELRPITRNGPLLASESYKLFSDNRSVLAFGGKGIGFPLHRFDLKRKVWSIVNFPSDDVPISSLGTVLWTGESIITMGGYLDAGTKDLFGAVIEPPG